MLPISTVGLLGRGLVPWSWWNQWLLVCQCVMLCSSSLGNSHKEATLSHRRDIFFRFSFILCDNCFARMYVWVAHACSACGGHKTVTPTMESFVVSVLCCLCFFMIDASCCSLIGVVRKQWISLELWFFLPLWLTGTRKLKMSMAKAMVLWKLLPHLLWLAASELLLCFHQSLAWRFCPECHTCPQVLLQAWRGRSRTLTALFCEGGEAV